MSSALRWGMGGQHHAPAALPPGKTRYPLYRGLGGPLGPVWTDAENLAPTGIRSPDRPARSESLYRLSYPGPLSNAVPARKFHCLISSSCIILITATNCIYLQSSKTDQSASTKCTVFELQYFITFRYKRNEFPWIRLQIVQICVSGLRRNFFFEDCFKINYGQN